MKKIFITLTSAIITSAPVVIATSCGPKSFKPVDSYIEARANQSAQAREFNSIPVDGIAWNLGVPFHSSSQSISFILNLSETLGWKKVADRLDFDANIASAPNQAQRDLTTQIKQAFDGLSIMPTPATPANVYRMDPIGSSGSMEDWWRDNNSTHNGFDAGPLYGQNSIFGSNDKGNGNFDKIGRIYNYEVMIDGNEPGSTIYRIWLEGLDGHKYVKTWHSSPHVIRTYPLATPTQVEEIAKKVVAAFANLKAISSPSQIALLKSYVNADFSNWFEWITSAQITESQVKDAVVKFNNGSHHIDAVLGFLDGWKNIPEKEQVDGNDYVVGITSVKDSTALFPWFKYRSKDVDNGNQDYIKK